MGEEQHHADYANVSGLTKEETLQHIIDSFVALSNDTNNWVANLSNCASLLWYGYLSIGTRVNWTGFYVNDTSVSSKELILGPFQGKVACQSIAYGRGVCGTAAETKQTQLVANVHDFPGHVACDGETNSEIVVPLLLNGEVVGVLDLDCLDVNGFDELDKKYLEVLAAEVVKACNWDKL